MNANNGITGPTVWNSLPKDNVGSQTCSS